MAELLGAESSLLLDALAADPSVGLRFNGLRLKTDDEAREFRKRLPWRLESVPWCPSGFTVEDGVDEQRPGAHPWHHAGAYYLQDPAAMAVAEALAPRPGERVLDLAAAPGGKTTHIAALQEGRGILVSNDVHLERARSLLGNVERCGVEHALVCHGEIERLARALPGWFDRVLLDAPCSGEGMFRKSEAAREAWSNRTVVACAQRQASLIGVAADCVRPGGTLAYSTCTFSRAENEDVVESFVTRRPDFSLVEVKLPGTSQGLGALTGALRVWPHLAVGEGHFVAVLQRTDADAETPNPRSKTGRQAWPGPTPELLRAWRDYVSENAVDPAAFSEERLVGHGDRLLLAPSGAPKLESVHLLRLGLALGELRREGRKARFVPAHAAAMAYSAYWRYEELEVDDPRVARYLVGEGFDAAGPDGWVVVRAGGFPLGWGRRRTGSVRSMLPTGLRVRVG